MLIFYTRKCWLWNIYDIRYLIVCYCLAQKKVQFYLYKDMLTLTDTQCWHLTTYLVPTINDVLYFGNMVENRDTQVIKWLFNSRTIKRGQRIKPGRNFFRLILPLNQPLKTTWLVSASSLNSPWFNCPFSDFTL